MRTNADLTIYNRYVVNGSERYQRTWIQAIAWENRKAANVLRSGLLEADSVAVYIPLERGASYLSPRAWGKLADKSGKWTLQPGDYLVKGLVSDEIVDAVPGSDGPPPVPAQPAFTITDLKAKYDDVVRINSVDRMDYGSPHLHHWQIGAS